jgi:hypothetical protein
MDIAAVRATDLMKQVYQNSNAHASRSEHRGNHRGQRQRLERLSMRNADEPALYPFEMEKYMDRGQGDEERDQCLVDATPLEAFIWVLAGRVRGVWPAGRRRISDRQNHGTALLCTPIVTFPGTVFYGVAGRDYRDKKNENQDINDKVQPNQVHKASLFFVFVNHYGVNTVSQPPPSALYKAM